MSNTSTSTSNATFSRDFELIKSFQATKKDFYFNQLLEGQRRSINYWSYQIHREMMAYDRSVDVEDIKSELSIFMLTALQSTELDKITDPETFEFKTRFNWYLSSYRQKMRRKYLREKVVFKSYEGLVEVGALETSDNKENTGFSYESNFFEKYEKYLTLEEKHLLDCLMRGIELKQLGIALGLTTQAMSYRKRKLFEKIKKIVEAESDFNKFE